MVVAPLAGSRLPPAHAPQPDPSRLRQAFEPCRDVRTITEEIPILDGDVTQVDAHPELDALVSSTFGSVRPSLAATRRYTVHHAAELGKEAVTRSLNQPAVMRGDLVIEQLYPG